MKKPNNPLFSSGPTTKRPGWELGNLSTKSIGRSHRSALGLSRITYMITLTRKILEIPDDYLVALVPGSCTGAIELLMWNILGPRPVDVFSWDLFGKLWLKDALEELRLKDLNVHTAPDGAIPDLSLADPARDCLFTYNATTTGVRVPNLDWISSHREGLTLCDATSALFAIKMDWSKVDGTAFSWQKCLGGEAAHGIVVLSPRAVSRIESYTPSWPMPRLFRIKKDGKINRDIFEGKTINTPSLLCIEDVIDALEWCENLGGLQALINRSSANLALIEEWVSKTPWIDFVAEASVRSSTSICLKLVDLDPALHWPVIRSMTKLLESEGVAYDISGHALSSPCLRIWGGPTVEADDIKVLLPWIDFAYNQEIINLKSTG